MKKWIHASTSTRDRISYLESRIDTLESYIEECRANGSDLEDTIDEQLELEELREQLNFAWQDDEAEYNYAVQQQEFNPDGSLKLYSSTSIKANTNWKESYDADTSKHCWTLETPNGVASVCTIEGDRGYEVKIDEKYRRKGDLPIYQLFKPSGNMSDKALLLYATEWAEKQLAESVYAPKSSIK